MIKIRQRKYTISVAVTVFAFQSCIEIWAELLLEDSLKISDEKDEDLYLMLGYGVILYRLVFTHAFCPHGSYIPDIF